MSREAGGHSGLSSIQAEVYKILSKWWVTRTIARKVNKGRDGFILYLSITVRLLDTYKISCVPSKMATLFENKTKRIYKTIYPTVRRKRQNVHHQWRIQDFPWGGGGVLTSYWVTDSRGGYVLKILCVKTKESGPLGAQWSCMQKLLYSVQPFFLFLHVNWGIISILTIRVPSMAIDFPIIKCYNIIPSKW